MVLVTHNLQLLNFVDRLIVVANNRIVLDGPKDEVIARLKGAQVNAARATPPAATPQPAPATQPANAAQSARIIVERAGATAGTTEAAGNPSVRTFQLN